MRLIARPYVRSSIDDSATRTKVKVPIAYRVGRTISRKASNAVPRPVDWASSPRATRLADNEPTYRAARAVDSLTVFARAPCSVKCSVVNIVSNADPSGPVSAADGRWSFPEFEFEFEAGADGSLMAAPRCRRQTRSG